MPELMHPNIGQNALTAFGLGRQQRDARSERDFQMQERQRAEASRNALSRYLPQTVDPKTRTAAVQGIAAEAPEAFAPVLEMMRGLNNDERAAAAEENRKTGAFFHQLQSTPYEARAAALQQAATSGMIDPELAGIDPNDQNVGMIVARSMTLTELLTKANADRTFTAGRQDADRNFQAGRSDAARTATNADRTYQAGRSDAAALNADRDADNRLAQDRLAFDKAKPGAGAGENYTDVQSKDRAFYSRGAHAEETLAKLDTALTFTGGPQGARGIADSAIRSIPLVGDGGLANLAVSSERKSAENASQEFLWAILRKDSGAAISGTETETGNKLYFPQPGESDANVQRKRENRRVALEAIKSGLGAAGADLPLFPGIVEDGYRFKGGDPKDQNNWEPVS